MQRKIEEYIKHQLDEDKAGEQLGQWGNFLSKLSPLTGSKQQAYASVRPYQRDVTRGKTEGYAVQKNLGYAGGSLFALSSSIMRKIVCRSLTK